MKRSITLIGLLLLAMLLYAACGDKDSSADSSNSSSSSASTDNSGQAIPTPTQMSGSFKSAGEQSILTDTAKLLETQKTTDTSAADAVTGDASVGERSYAKNKCADCHGAKGEGVADKGKAIAGTSLSFAEFEKVVRTGNGLGNTHIFGPSAVSPKGMEGLYAYVMGLK